MNLSLSPVSGIGTILLRFLLSITVGLTIVFSGSNCFADSRNDYITGLTLLENKDYNVQNAYVFSNEREIKSKGKITYMPVYAVIVLEKSVL